MGNHIALTLTWVIWFRLTEFVNAPTGLKVMHPNGKLVEGKAEVISDRFFTDEQHILYFILFF